MEFHGVISFVDYVKGSLTVAARLLNYGHLFGGVYQIVQNLVSPMWGQNGRLDERAHRVLRHRDGRLVQIDTLVHNNRA